MMRNPVRGVLVAVRWALGTAFLSAVADRLGWWGLVGQGANTSWGGIGPYTDYVQQLLPVLSGWVLATVAWTATVAEIILGVLLLTGWRPRLVGAASCLLLIMFGVVMAISLGLETPFSYSVFTAASAAAVYAVLDEYPSA